MFLYIIIALIFTSLSSCQQFRSDYEYNRKTSAFYKLHIETYSKLVADKVCDAEGAELMLPSSDLDIAQVHGMLKKYPDIGEYAWVKEDNMQRESVEEQAIIDMESNESPRSTTPTYAYPWTKNCEVITRNGEVKNDNCLRLLPFICKVEAKATYFDRTCDVYGKYYQYISSVGSCYRVSNIAYSWNSAYAECNAEGAHLVVLNSDAEQQAVWNIINNAPEAHGARESWFFFAGFRANKSTGDKPRVFKTIFNQTLEEAGFSLWADNEPNNAKNNENCGSIFKNDGKLNDLDCALLYPFICEKEIHLKSN